MGIAEDLVQLEQQLRKLKMDYEKYFAGLEKREPVELRETVAQTIRKYSGANLTNTGLSFRLNSLIATFSSYNAYWGRVVRQIEEGTYARDRFRLKLKERQQGAAASAQAGSGAQPAAGRPSSSAATFRGDGGEPDRGELRGLYEALVTAKRKTGEPVDGLGPDKLATVIKQQLPKITKQFNCRSVEFRVVVENGKAKLKALPK